MFRTKRAMTSELNYIIVVGERLTFLQNAKHRKIIVFKITYNHRERQNSIHIRQNMQINFHKKNNFIAELYIYECLTFVFSKSNQLGLN